MVVRMHYPCPRRMLMHRMKSSTALASRAQPEHSKESFYISLNIFLLLHLKEETFYFLAMEFQFNMNEFT